MPHPDGRFRYRSERRDRTYVVLAYPVPRAARDGVAVLGTVRAADRHTAAPRAMALARAHR